MVEFALISVLVVLIMVVAIQGAIIADASLAVNQLAYQGARYAAVNPTYDQTAVSNYVISVASPAIGENNGADLTVTMNPSTAPRTFGTSVSLTISYNAANKVVLPNPFLGISFPTTLNATQTAMSE